MARYCQDNPIGTALRELAEQFLLLPEPGHHTADATGTARNALGNTAGLW